MFFGLFKSEVDEKDLVDGARSVLEGIRQGLSEPEAAKRAGVSGDELRRWKRKDAYREAIRRAKREEPGLTARGICSLEQFAPPEDPHAIPPPGASEPPPGTIFGPQWLR
jgi:hypothetical protein